MFKSYFVASFKLWRRNWAGFAIAFFGLAFAFSITLVVSFYLYDNIRSDSWVPDGNLIYRLNTESLYNGQPLFSTSARSHGPLAEYIPDLFEEIESAERLYQVDVTANFNDVAEAQQFTYVDKGFFDLFPVVTVDGNISAAMAAPHGLVLTKSAAFRIYGDDISSAIGSVLAIELEGKSLDYTIRAVIEDLPSNTMLKYSFITLFHAADLPNANAAWPQVYTFVKTKRDLSEVRRLGLSKDINQKLQSHIPPSKQLEFTLSIESILGAQFFSEAASGLKNGVNKEYAYIFAGVAGLMLITVALNYINVMTAINVLRGKEIAIRRIAGASRKGLLFLFVFEGLFISVLAFIIAFLIAFDLAASFENILQAKIAIIGDGRWIPFSVIGLLVIFIGCGTAIFPALKLLSTRPEAMLRASQGTVVGGRGRSRQILVTMQTLVMMVTVLGAYQVLYQVNHLVSYDRGFTVDNLLTIEPPGKENKTLFRTGFRERVKNMESVKATSFARSVPFDNRTFIIPFAHIETGELDNIPASTVGLEYFDLLNVSLIAKLEEDWSVIERPVAINEYTAKKLGFADSNSAIGRSIFRRVNYDDGREKDSEYKIVAIVPDLEEGIGGEMRKRVYELSGSEVYEDVRLLVQVQETFDSNPVEAFETIWRDMFPGKAFKSVWLNDTLEETYAIDKALGEAIIIVGVIALVLASAGLYGMASHWLITRRRELALRSVMGASKARIISLAFGKMVLPVLIGGILAIVIFIYIAGLWLEGYSNKAPLSFWAYWAAFVSLLVYAAMILVGHITVALRERPAKVLYHE